jgi:hypothetical protein
VLSGTQFTEIEYAVEATTSATDGAVYCFRLTDAGSPSDFTYTENEYGYLHPGPGIRAGDRGLATVDFLVAAQVSHVAAEG